MRSRSSRGNRLAMASTSSAHELMAAVYARPTPPATKNQAVIWVAGGASPAFAKPIPAAPWPVPFALVTAPTGGCLDAVRRVLATADDALVCVAFAQARGELEGSQVHYASLPALLRMKRAFVRFRMRSRARS